MKQLFLTLIIILLLSVIIIFSLGVKLLINPKKEHFTCAYNSISKTIPKTIPKTENNIWMYWENKPGAVKPSYLKLCYDTVLYHCKSKFNIYLINEKTIYKYLPNLRRDLASKLDISPKSDYLRYQLLEKYGGIWIDADTIIIQDIIPIMEKLKTYDFVGFGCHYSDKICQKVNGGFPRPATWVMASRKNGILMKLCCKACDTILDNDRGDLRDNYFGLGRNLLWKQIDYLLDNDPSWKYYHYNSKCIERDSNGNKIRNNRSISNENIDSYCKTKYMFVPIYNTAPGFPKWFIKMDKKSILNSNMLISKLFRYSLEK